uniref:Leucine-rich repeat protein (LRRP) n=1 Tax=Trypanosoma congolense (strain IL3000) TaxID=1068625 RepID=G0URI1_TRYCI|nr:conserved hypothetical protein [Trypanosoma congolense IL3000]
MWEEVYQRACANHGVKPREEILSAVDKNHGVVKLCGNVFENFNQRFTDDEMVAFSEACPRVPLVTVLRLPYNVIGARGAIALARAIEEGFITLQHIDLSYNSIDGEGASALATAATSCELLSTLLLAGNPIGGIPGPSLMNLLESKCSQLVVLNLEKTDQDLSSIVHIARGLAHNTTLTTLNLGRPLLSNPMDVSYAMEHLSIALGENRTLQCLQLNYFSITDYDLEILLSTLCNSAVCCITLRGNKLSQASGEKLAELLVRRPDFTVLDLSANRLRDVGASAIASVITHHPGLRELELCCNTIGGVGISAIARSIAGNVSLSKLTLWGNDFTDGSVEDLYAVRDRLQQMDCTDFSFYVVDGRPMVARE